MNKATIIIIALAFAVPVFATTIVVDGANDFPAAALIDEDAGDTEFTEIDFGDIYITNDLTNLYIGYEHDNSAWGAVQVGIAIGTVAGEGASADPWDRRIDFVGQNLPDYVAYKNIDTDYDDLVAWDEGGASWIYGNYDINWTVGTAFDELEIPLAELGLDCSEFTQIHVELWITQDDCSKGPLDLSHQDEDQLSTPGGTTWELNCDGSEDVQLYCGWCIILDCGPTPVDQETWSAIKSLWR